MRDGKCTTKFPKTFAETTNIVFAENAVLEDVLSRQRHTTKSKICEYIRLIVNERRGLKGGVP